MEKKKLTLVNILFFGSAALMATFIVLEMFKLLFLMFPIFFFSVIYKDMKQD